MKRREFERKMRQSGWSLLREGGSHAYWVKNGVRFALPRHNEVKPGIARQWEAANREANEKGED